MTVAWLRAFAATEIRDEVLEDTAERTIYSTFAAASSPGTGRCCWASASWARVRSRKNGHYAFSADG